MTQKLYYLHPETEECWAVVTDCVKEDDAYYIATDSTVIFPEGGGQPSDFGFLGGHRVSRAIERNGDVLHLVDAALPIGSKQRMRVDIDRRLENSQQHTGEHILSGCAKSMFGINNVGFHMAEDYATIDLDGELKTDELDALEDAANACVYKNLPINYDIVTEGELGSFKLRKKASGLHGDIRIVSINGVDSCTCCGTHCLTTGSVGAIKIVSHQRYKGGVRIWFMCGIRAIHDYRRKQALLDSLSNRFSTGLAGIDEAVKKQGDDLSTLKREFKERTRELLSLKSQKLLDEAKDVNGVKLAVIRQDGLKADDLKLLSESMLHDCERLIFTAVSMSEETLLYRIAVGNGVLPELNDVVSVVNGALNARGGGRAPFAQGSAKKPCGIDESMASISSYLEKVARLKQ